MINGCIKTIGGFCNTGGGNLLIGLSNNKELVGIEVDNFESNDIFLQSLTQNISNRTDPDIMNLPGVIDISFFESENKTICNVEVEPSPKNIFVKFQKKKIFYKRKGPKTVSLDPQEMLIYTKEREKIYK